MDVVIDKHIGKLTGCCQFAERVHNHRGKCAFLAAITTQSFGRSRQRVQCAARTSGPQICNQLIIVPRVAFSSARVEGIACESTMLHIIYLFLGQKSHQDMPQDILISV